MLAGLTENNKLFVIGENTTDGVYDSGENYYSGSTLENVVDVVPGGYSMTALMSPNGNCNSGCSVTTFGYILRPVPHVDGLMGDAANLSDITEVYGAYSAYMAKRTNGSWVVWGSDYSGADLTASTHTIHVNH